MKFSASNIPTSWLLYKKYISNSLIRVNRSSFSIINGWQDRLFATLVTYIIPLSTIAVISCIIMELKMGHKTIAGFDVLTIVLVIMLMLQRQIPVSIKKVILIVAAVAFSLISAIVFGYYNVGAIYLFGVSIFIAYQYSSIHAYISLLLNCFLWSLIGICIYFQLNWFPSNILFEHFVVFISNLLFLNIITVIIIRQTLMNFERSVLKESILYSKLQDELNVVDQLNIKLAESETQYKTLFFLSPLPK